MNQTDAEEFAMSEEISGAPTSDLARRIAHRREELGLTRDELARRAGMDAGYLEYFEQSPGAVLSSDALVRLARALETTAIALAGGHVERPPGSGRAGANPVLETLTREQCEEHLLAGGVGRVVFSAKRGSMALPVNFAFFEGHIVFRTGATASVTTALGAVVGFEVDRIDDAMSEGWSVLVTGRGERVENPSELEELESLGIEPWAGGDRETFVRIRAEEISGRAIRQER
jgi:hypothetical protein